MFGLFGRKKREQEFAAMMMGVAIEVRALVNTAIRTLGVDFKTDPNNTQYCINAVVAIVPVVMQRAGCDMEKLSKMDIYHGSLFAFTYSAHLCRIIGAPFETVSAVTLIPLFNRHVTDGMPDIMSIVVDIYNKLVEADKVIPIVGECFTQWLSDPSHGNFERMVTSFGTVRTTRW